MTKLQRDVSRAVLVFSIAAIALDVLLFFAGVARAWPYLGAVGLGAIIAVINEVPIARATRRTRDGS